MKKVYNILQCLVLVLVASAFITSCTKTLEGVKPASLITTGNFWQNSDDAEGGLTGMYVLLRSCASSIYLDGDMRSEVYTAGLTGGAPFILFDNTMTADNPGYVGNWYVFYEAINAANLVVKYVPGIAFNSKDEKNSILAQAYTTRAFLYFVLTRTYGDLVLRTDPTESTNPKFTQKARSSQQDVFKLIKSDIDTAISLFPNDNFSAGRGNWSKAGAYALKADVYLWTGKKMNGGAADFQVALDACNEVQKADVELLPNYADIFKFGNKGNKEIIMSIKFNNLEGTNDYRYTWIANTAVPSNISQEARNIILPTGNGLGLIAMTALVRNQFTTDDSRRNATFYEIYTHDGSGDSTYYTDVMLKGSGEIIGGSRIFDSDYILYRYADVLLMKAEAENALGLDPSVEINMVRKRAYGTTFGNHVFVNGSKEYNDSVILKERLLELAGEGKRWWSLVRFGKAFDLIPNMQSRKGQDYLLLSPIPTSILSLEPNVKQNPGY